MIGPDEEIAKRLNHVQRTTHKRTNTTDPRLCAASSTGSPSEAPSSRPAPTPTDWPTPARSRYDLGDQFGPPTASPEDILSVIAATPQGSVASLAAMHKESDACSR